MKRVVFILLIMILGLPGVAHSQKVALKTNVLSDGFMNVNLGIEFGLAPKWTLEIPWDYNNWKLSHSRQWKHWGIQPEARYWFCDRFSGHFLGIHAHGGQYSVGNIKNKIDFLGSDFSKLSNYRYEGWFVGAGIAYGYSFILGKHWNLEGEIGIGYAYTRFDSYHCAGCQRKDESDKDHHYVGPTRAAVNLVYVF